MFRIPPRPLKCSLPVVPPSPSGSPSQSEPSPLRRGLDLGQRFPLLESPLLLQAHDLEAVKVRQGLSSVCPLPRLECVGLLPLVLDAGLLPERLDGLGPRAPCEFVDDDLGQQAVGEREFLSGDGQLRVGVGSVDEDLCKRLV